MTFRIKRASDPNGTKKPCDDARLKIIERKTRIGSVKSETDETIELHRIVEEVSWTIYIDSMTELMQLCSKVGYDVIVSEYDRCITISDADIE